MPATASRDHWEQFGKNEGRDSTPFFDWEVYRDNNPDLAEAGLTTKLQLTQHFITYGYNEDRLFVSEKIFDAAYYAKQNPDLEQAGITSAPSLQQHFLTLGMHEGREFHPDFNGTAYIESNADLNALMNAGGNIGGYSKDEINTAGIYHYLNWGINEGRSVPPAPEPPAPPPVVDEGPTLYFSISLSSNVVSFQTNVSGDITMAKSGDDAVFSKPGGYQQTQTNFFTDETNFTLCRTAKYWQRLQTSLQDSFQRPRGLVASRLRGRMVFKLSRAPRGMMNWRAVMASIRSLEAMGATLLRAARTTTP